MSKAPEKLHAPSSNRGAWFGAWNLGLLWCLGLGVWCFDSGISLELGVGDWVFRSFTARPGPITAAPESRPPPVPAWRRDTLKADPIEMGRPIRRPPRARWPAHSCLRLTGMRKGRRRRLT